MLTDEQLLSIPCFPWGKAIDYLRGIEAAVIADQATKPLLNSEQISSNADQGKVPVAWVDTLDTARPRCVTSLDYRSVTEAKLGVEYIPLYAIQQPPAPCPSCQKLASSLKKANDNHEHFERNWYLRGDEIESLQAKVVELSEAHRLSALNAGNWKRQFDAAMEKVAELDLYTGNLLARIHRDGGHYQAEFGNGKAVRDADLIVAETYAKVAEQAALIALCEDALGHYLHGGSNFKKPAEQALIAIENHLAEK
jgi:hypothetical protein